MHSLEPTETIETALAHRDMNTALSDFQTTILSNQPTSQLINLPTNRPTNQAATNLPNNQPTKQPTNQPPTYLPINEPPTTNLLTNALILRHIKHKKLAQLPINQLMYQLDH